MEKDTKSSVCENDIKKFVRKLKRKTIYFFDIPEEYRLHPLIIKAERSLGIRKSVRRGYDIIHCRYFVEEIVLESDNRAKYEKNFFTDFASYYDFLEGDIYENACYFQHHFLQTDIDTYHINLDDINTIALIDEKISIFTKEVLSNELDEYYDKSQQEKAIRQEWIDEFNKCRTYEEFELCFSNYYNALGLCNNWSFNNHLMFFIYNFIDANKDKAFDIVMEYASNGRIYSNQLYGLCSIYDPDKILAAYHCNRGAVSTQKKHKGRLNYYAICLKNNNVKFYDKKYFDEESQFFVLRTLGYIGNEKFPKSERNQYFVTFEEFATHLNNDLSGCDLSKAHLPDIDFTRYKTDQNTELPIQRLNELSYSLDKSYDRKSEQFIVEQKWKDKEGNVKKSKGDTFDFFFDFLYFLNNDLSGADLLFCDGLENLYDFTNINLKNTRLKSTVLDRIGIEYSRCISDNESVELFPLTVKNEEETLETLLSNRNDCLSWEEKHKYFHTIYYVSDLHLDYRIRNSNCRTENDVLYVVQRIIDAILCDSGRTILIGGDTASNYSLFCFFVRLLRESMDKQGYSRTVIFVLGNHELWEFAGYSFKDIVKQYAKVITEQKMYLLQNDIIYFDDYSGIERIVTDELVSLPSKEIRERLKTARVILFGGLAFSGCNETFNANNGIYRQTIDRKQEIYQSKEFEKIYNIVCKMLSDKTMIIFTHTPKSCWCKNSSLQSGFIYVSGHTHRNYFYDDGEYKVYADNQIGYKNKTVGIKYFYVENKYDLFSEYSDGIYEITRQQYIDFYRGCNLQMQFGREINKLFMLKKSGYYCFIHESEKKILAILNGGRMTNLNKFDKNYYLNNMDRVIAHMKSPLDKYTSVQNVIANEIKSIGGIGTIHGAIIDIDFYNHIYVNPFDLTITGYWAQDMITKKVFSNIPDLLEENCPNLFANYMKRINGENNNIRMIASNTTKKSMVRSVDYLETNIYSASRKIKSMQKLNSNILTEWYEPTKKMLE